MSLSFQELDFQSTPLGDISLRRREEPQLNNQVLYEVKLNDEFLMSSLFTEAEEQLASLALEKFDDESELDIIVGGLGLGYTAAAVLKSDKLHSLCVIDVMQAVIDWHQKGLVPLGETLRRDNRCSFLHADFFELATAADTGFPLRDKIQRVDAVLLDIDHSPSHWLNPENARFYSQEGLQSLASKLNDKGLFGLWSNDPPEIEFEDLLGSVFQTIETHNIEFPNPYTGKNSANTVYLAIL